MDEIIPTFMCFANEMKLYHWRTKSFARHKASCKFMELFDEKMDRFAEVLFGSKNKRFQKDCDLILKQHDDNEMVECAKNFRQYLQKDIPIDKKDTDLLNIRDEILADVNRLLYLFTLK